MEVEEAGGEEAAASATIVDQASPHIRRELHKVERFSRPRPRTVSLLVSAVSAWLSASGVEGGRLGEVVVVVGAEDEEAAAATAEASRTRG